MLLEIKNLSFSYGKRTVLDDISFSVSDGDFLSVLGPNGVGKSTLFKCILGTLEGYSGEILIDGKNIKEFSRRQLAKCIAYIPQIHRPTFGYSVLDTVLMGLAHNMSVFSKPNRQQIKDAMNALGKLGIKNLAERDFSRLSGGEQQIVLVARAIAQNAKILIMDEPTSALDFGNQIRVLEQVCQLSEEGYAVLLSTHNPQHALSYSNKTLALNKGKLTSFGNSSEVISEELLGELYSVPVILENTNGGKTIVPIRHKGMFQWKPEMVRMMQDASEYGNYHQTLVNEILPYIKSTDSVCDAGCGLGYLSTALSPYVKEISAIDINSDALKVLEENCKKSGIENIKLCNGNAAEDFDLAQFDDIIFCFYGTDEEIIEASKKTDSRLIIMRKNYLYHRFSVGSYKESAVNNEILDNYLRASGRKYISKELEIEFGQPFRNLEDAILFYRTYSVDDDKSLITEEFVSAKLIKTDDPVFPYYLPHLRSVLLTIVEREKND